MTSPHPPIEAEADPTPESVGALTVILLDAYDYAGGRAAIDAAIAPHGYRVRTHLGGENTPLDAIFDTLWERAADAGKTRGCVEAFFASLAGNSDVRAWVARFLPHSLHLVPEDAFDRARPIYEASVQARRQEADAVAGFAALRDASGQAFVAEEIRAFRGGLRSATESLQRLERYKQLHDELHTVQTLILPPLSRLILRTELDPSDAREAAPLQAFLARQAKAAHDVLALFDADARADEEVWIRELSGIAESLGEGRHADLAALRGAAFGLRSLLRQHLPMLSGRLGGVARGIPFDGLVQLLQRASGRAGPAQPKLAAKLDQAARGLADLAARVESMVSAHDGWQAVDTALWAIEAELPETPALPWPGALAMLWGGIVVRLDELLPRDDDALIALAPGQPEFLRESRDAVSGALGSGDWPAAAAAFRGFSDSSRQHFHKVDRALLFQCNEVARLRGTLEELVEGGP